MCKCVFAVGLTGRGALDGVAANRDAAGCNGINAIRNLVEVWCVGVAKVLANGDLNHNAARTDAQHLNGGHGDFEGLGEPGNKVGDVEGVDVSINGDVNHHGGGCPISLVEGDGERVTADAEAACERELVRGEHRVEDDLIAGNVVVVITALRVDDVGVEEADLVVGEDLIAANVGSEGEVG